MHQTVVDPEPKTFRGRSLKFGLRLHSSGFEPMGQGLAGGGPTREHSEVAK